MNKQERAYVTNVRNFADSLLAAKGRGQEHAARYMLTVSIRQLIDWAEERAAKASNAGEGKL